MFARDAVHVRVLVRIDGTLLDHLGFVVVVVLLLLLFIHFEPISS
jgi:hypothetical protein